MRIQLSDHFTYKRLFRFTLPSVVMMVFTSIYGVVDGLFVSNFVGKTPFAAVNLVIPVLMIFGAVGFMIGTGGSAIVAKTLGEGDSEKAKRYFSLLIYTTIAIGAILTVLGEIFIRPILSVFGASGEMLEDSVLYGRINLISLSGFMLQNVFHSFLVTAEKPKLGLAVTVGAGVTNIILDFFFVAVFRWGLIGAAVATSISETVGGFLPLLYFMSKNNSLLRLTKTKFEGRILLRTFTNGSSELMTNLSMSIVNMLYNFQLIRISGENGVAAYGVIMYVNFAFVSIFLGYSIGCAPIIGYNYGAGNHKELKNMLRKSLIVIFSFGIIMSVLGVLSAAPLTGVFVGYDAELYELTRRGFMIYALSFLFCGAGIFGSAFFTALGNGGVSAAISFLRTLVFQVFAVLILPIFWGIDGIWFAIVVAEFLALILSVVFLVINRNKYHYF